MKSKDTPAEGKQAVIKALDDAAGVKTLKDLPEDVVYEIVKAICEDKDKEDIQGSAFSLVKVNDFAEMTMQYANFPLHVGALKYYRERGLTIPSEVIPPEAK